MLSDGHDSDSSDESYQLKKGKLNGNSAAKRKRTKRKSTKTKAQQDKYETILTWKKFRII